MFPMAAKKSCCNKAGQCERPSKSTPLKECRQMPLEPHGFASAHAELAAAISTAETGLLFADIEVPSMAVEVDTPAADPSPPDLFVLHSAFLI
jgi:hypothetical protein